MLINAILLAIRQIAKNPMRSLLTVLGVVIGVAAVITMVTIGDGASYEIKSQIESFGNNQLLLRPGMRLGARKKVGAPFFRLQDSRVIESQVAGIEAAANQVSKPMMVVAGSKNWSTTVIGTENSFFVIDNRELVAGRFFEPQEMMAGSAVCIIGKTIQKELFGESVSPIGKKIRAGNFSCRVVGLLKEKGSSAMVGDEDDFVVMPITTVQRRIVGDTRVNSILLKMNDTSERERIKFAVRELMRERRSLSKGEADDFSIMDTAEIAEKVESTTKIMTALLGAVAGVSLLVGGIGIMNIMLVSVTERTREIGIRLAIGALGKEVQMQFLVEALVLGCLGGVIGVGIAYVLSILITKIMSVPFLFNLNINIIAFTVSALTGVLFGYFPARKAANMDPIEAVRHE